MDFSSNYKIIEPQEYLRIINDSDCEYLYEIEFNKSSLYKVGDANYMVLPLASTELGVITSNRESIDVCIKNQKFDVPDYTQNVFSSCTQQIFNYLNTPNEAFSKILRLFDCSEYDSNTVEFWSNEIDSFTRHFGKKNIKKSHLIEFYFFVGEVIAKRNRVKWALIKNYLGLNPYYVPTVIDSVGYEYSIVSFVDDYLSSKMNFEELICQIEMFKHKKLFFNPNEIILSEE